MTRRCVIEVSDVALRLSDSEGLRAESPSHAVVDGRQLLVGRPARDRARINPRQSFDRFWSTLDQQPLTQPAGQARSHADIAYFHLQALWTEAGGSDDDVVFAVPGDWQRDALALLLGIAQACGIRAVGLVPAPLAAAAALDASEALPERMQLLDLQRHRVRRSEVRRNGQLSLGDTLEALPRGLSAIHDHWVSFIAGRFLQATRFDPLHRAETEQMLYAQLPDWLDALETAPAVNAALDVAGRNYQVEITRQALIEAAAPDYRALLSAVGGDVAIGMGYWLSALPGLDAAFRQGGIALRRVGVDDVAQAVLAHWSVIATEAESPAFVTRLPVAAEVARAVPGTGEGQNQAVPPAYAKAVPTHVVDGAALYVLHRSVVTLADGSRVQIGDDGQVRCKPVGRTLHCNGEPLHAERVLAPGDYLTVEGRPHGYRLVREMPQDAPPQA